MKRLFAVVAPGLEAAALAELRAAGFAAVEPVPGGATFDGDPLRANRVLAIPSRILQRVARYDARTFDALVAGAAAVDWTPFGGLTPEVTCRKSRLYHSGAVAERLAAVVPPGPGGLYVRLYRDRCTLSVDTSGELLHRRGWRPETGAAPLRETLAAGILRLAGWTPGEALYDPMCGSGTLLIEAAVAAAGLAPGRLRGFACERWCPPAEVPRAAPVPTVIAGGDRSAAAVEAAKRNAERAGVEIAVEAIDARHAEAPAPRGLVVCNPPYGRRARLGDAYRVLGERLTGDLATWRAAILCPDPAAARALRRDAVESFPLHNGGLKVSLVVARASR